MIYAGCYSIKAVGNGQQMISGQKATEKKVRKTVDKITAAW